MSYLYAQGCCYVPSADDLLPVSITSKGKPASPRSRQLTHKQEWLSATLIVVVTAAVLLTVSVQTGRRGGGIDRPSEDQSFGANIVLPRYATVSLSRKMLAEKATTSSTREEVPKAQLVTPNAADVSIAELPGEPRHTVAPHNDDGLSSIVQAGVALTEAERGFHDEETGEFETVEGTTEPMLSPVEEQEEATEELGYMMPATVRKLAAHDDVRHSGAEIGVTTTCQAARTSSSRQLRGQHRKVMA